MLWAVLLLCIVVVVVQAQAREPATVKLEYFTLPGCHDCSDLEYGLVKNLRQKYEQQGLEVQNEQYSVLDADGYRLVLDRFSQQGQEFSGAPVLIVNGRIFQGNELDEAFILSRTTLASVDNSSRDTGERALSPLPALSVPVLVLAGLIDGINPCAMTALLFLLSVLGLERRNRLAMLSTGAGFILGVFCTYMGIGVGLVKAAVLGQSVPSLVWVFRIVTITGLATLAVLSLRDAWHLRRNNATAVMLKLPDGIQTRIHGFLRKFRHKQLVFGAAMLIGIVLSLLEFVCTGQVYLPAIMYMVQSGEQGALGWLLLYNLAFVLPLFAVFGAVILGSSHATLMRLFTVHVAGTKIALGAVFSVLAVLFVGSWFV